MVTANQKRLSIAYSGDVNVMANLTVNSGYRINGMGSTPIGTIIAFAGPGPDTGYAPLPPGWLECNGLVVNRTYYNELFLVISTTWGNGDGFTTFNLPDLRGVFPRGLMTMANISFAASAVNTGFDLINAPGHEFNKSGVAFRFFPNGSTLPSHSGSPFQFNYDTTYYSKYISPIQFQIADINGNVYDITSQGTGTHLIIQWVDPDRSSRKSMDGVTIIGKQVGSYQKDEFKSHTHTEDGHAPFMTNSSGTYYGVGTPSGTNTGASGGKETRPINAYVKYIIYVGKV